MVVASRDYGDGRLRRDALHARKVAGPEFVLAEDERGRLDGGKEVLHGGRSVGGGDAGFHVASRFLDKVEHFGLLRSKQYLRAVLDVFAEELGEVQEHLAFAEACAVEPQEGAFGPRAVEAVVDVET